MRIHRATEFASAPIGQASAEIASPLASKIQRHGFDYGVQHALHVIDFNMRSALAHLQAIGACNRRTRKLNDDEFDYNEFSIENGDGGIY